MPSVLPSVQSGCLFKTTFYAINFFLLNSFATGNQHSERIKQDCVPIDINPLITHPTHQRLSTPTGYTSPTIIEQRSVGSYTSHTDVQISEDSESAVRRDIRFFVLIRED